MGSLGPLRLHGAFIALIYKSGMDDIPEQYLLLRNYGFQKLQRDIVRVSRNSKCYSMGFQNFMAIFSVFAYKSHKKVSISLEIVGKGSRATTTIGVFTRNVYENRHFVNDAILFVLLFSDELFRFQELTCVPEIVARFWGLTCIPINLNFRWICPNFA